VGTTAEPWIAERREALQVNAEIAEVRSYQEGLERVLARRSDALFGDRAILLDAAAHSPAAGDLIVLARFYTHEPIALAFARGDEDFRLLVDRTLSRLYRSGEIRDIYARFFGEPDENALTLFQLVALPE
jgi:ABC-type amino acid transport substrate-binding protein